MSIHAHKAIRNCRGPMEMPLTLPQELGNTLWAAAVLEHHPGAPLLDAAAAHILRRLEHFGPADTSNSLWAYARLFHYPGPELLQVPF